MSSESGGTILGPMTDEERERLRRTLEGMANAAWNKHPKASAGDLTDLWRQVVAEADKRRRAQTHQRRRSAHLPKQPTPPRAT